MLLLGMASLAISVVAIQVQRKSGDALKIEERNRCEYASQSGLNTALAALDGSSAWSGTGTPQVLPTLQRYSYNVNLLSNLTGTTSITAPDGTQIPPKMIYIESVSYVDGKSSVTLAGVAYQKMGSKLAYPAFGAESIEVGPGTTVDALDASNSVIPGKGALRTNGIQNGAVHLASGSSVDGDITVGTGADPLAAIQADAGSAFSGQGFQAGANMNIPDSLGAGSPTGFSGANFEILIPVPIPFVGTYYMRSAIYNPDHYGALQIGNSVKPHILLDMNIMLGSLGEFEADNVTFSSTGFLWVFPVGKTKVNFKDTLVALPGTVISGTDSSDMQFYGLNPNSTATLLGVAGGMVVVGSKTEITANGCNIIGALAGKKVTMNGSAIHYPTTMEGTVFSENVPGAWAIQGIHRIR